MVKRLFDLLLTIPGTLVILPFLLVLALLVRLFHGSPLFFMQVRPGRHGKPFTMYKFRTMTDARDAAGNLLPDSERLTPLGRFLRATSLDEFPELINVLKGDMSLVGPRPLLMEYLPRYSPEQYRRHEVKPGMTGWAQINGRNAISWDEKFMLDVWYVDNWSLWLDIRILAITMLNVVLRKGINHNSTETMPFFDGNKS
ncbi:MAG: sugar transferase [Geobacteraceae bacterium]|nr:sugar transferase [Geobacteraceae bacterium]